MEIYYKIEIKTGGFWLSPYDVRNSIKECEKFVERYEKEGPYRIVKITEEIVKESE